MELPSVSILISLYNKAAYIKQAAESALNQDYQGDFEVLICDDGSVDESMGVLENLRPNSKLKHILSQVNSGTAECRNNLMKYAKGQLFQHLDGDDWLEPYCIKERVELWLRHQDCGLIYSDFCSYIEETGKFIQEYRPHFDCLDNLQEYVCGTNVMVSSQAIETVGGYNKEFATIEDYELSLRISRAFPIMHLVRSHYVYRQSPSQKTVGMLKNSPNELNDEYRRLHLVKRKLFGI